MEEPREPRKYTDLVTNIASELNSPEKIHQRIISSAGSSTVARTNRNSVDRTLPRNWMESRIFEIWAQLLGTSEFGVHDGFIELGGHSLQAVQVLSRIRDIFGIDLPIGLMFEQSLTISALSKEVETFLVARTGLDPEIARQQLRAMSEEQINVILTSMRDIRLTSSPPPRFER